MKILQLAPRFPFPMDDGGKISIANITREFAKQDAEVTLFSFVEDKKLLSKKSIEQAEEFANVILYEHSTKNSLFRIFSSFLFNKSIYITKHSSRKVKYFLKEFLEKEKFDIVHADHSSMAPLALFCKSILNIPAGLRLHNIEWVIWQRYADNLSEFSLKRFYLNKQAIALKKAESEFLKQIDISFSITDIDKTKALAMSPGANVISASAGVNTEEWKPDEKIERNTCELILATTYNWIHNVEGLKWFIEKVLPIIKTQVREIKLTLIGTNPPVFLKDFENLGVQVVGYVEKVQPYLNRAGIYVSPLFVGSGIRIKILEAMAMELPVVATPVAAEGINANSDSGLFITSDVNKFADLILDLIRNPKKAVTAGKNAREFILKAHSWEKNIGIMLKEYNRLIENYRTKQ